MKKSINMIKYDRNNNSRKKTISELTDYNKRNLNKAPRLRKRIYIRNKVEQTLTEVKKVYDTYLKCSAVTAIYFIT